MPRRRPLLRPSAHAPPVRALFRSRPIHIPRSCTPAEEHHGVPSPDPVCPSAAQVSGSAHDEQHRRRVRARALAAGRTHPSARGVRSVRRHGGHRGQRSYVRDTPQRCAAELPRRRRTAGRRIRTGGQPQHHRPAACAGLRRAGPVVLDARWNTAGSPRRLSSRRGRRRRWSGRTAGCRARARWSAEAPVSICGSAGARTGRWSTSARSSAAVRPRSEIKGESAGATGPCDGARGPPR